ncbi:MAG: hypothetical protein GF311_27725 [Candidatus Lokiarchaeota archaeon]|nr:hypothetical protein [Candidatus Lokiarchaeota archaeon]
MDSICSFKDTKEGSICCIGTSMGGTSVLTKAYEDKRVAMVIAISTLHDVDSILNTNFKFPSSGWFVKRVMGKGKNRASFKMAAKYYLKSDLEYNENRVYLIHGKQDSIFPPDATFELNKKQSKIPEEHALLLEDCGHGLDNQKILLLGVVLKWILNNEKMNLS